MKPYNEEINAARLGLIKASQEIKEFTDSYSDQQIIELMIAVLKTPNALTLPGDDQLIWDSVRRRL